MENTVDNNVRAQASKKPRPEWFVIVPAFLAALAAFAVWGFGGPVVSVRGTIAAAFALLLFMLGFMIAVPKAVRFFKGEADDKKAEAGERSGIRRRMHPVAGIFLMALASRLIVYISAYVILLIAKGYPGSFFSSMQGIWLPSGSNPDLAGYGLFNPEYAQNELVMPLYPLLIKALDLVTRSSFVSGVILNALSTAAAAPLIYELVLCDSGRRTARMAVFFTLAMPASVFLAVPGCLALFMLPAAASLYAMRKGKFLLSGIFGALASFTHIWGILLLIPYAAEAAAHAAEKYRASGKEGLGKTIVKAVCFGLLIPLGIPASMLFTLISFGSFTALFSGDPVYLAALTDPLTYAAELTESVFRFFGSDNRALLGDVLPKLIYLYGSLLLFVASARTQRTSWSLWFAACFAVCGFTGFGSVPMLFTVTLAVPLALAHLCDSKDEGAGAGRAVAKAAAAGVVLLLGQLLYLVMLVI